MGPRLGRRSAKSSGRRARRRLLAEASPPELTVESWLLRPVRRRLSGPVVFTCGQTGGYVPATVLTREWRSNPGPVPTLTAFMGGAHDLLALELSHRITNIFAVISGVVTLSARGQPEMRPFARALQARMDALAAAHRCMRRTAPRWRRRRQTLFAPYRGASHETISVEGDDAAIRLQAAGTIALIVHELATNAVKHGAHSSDTGMVRISCAAADGRYRIDWREEGGPPLSGAPQHKGFGTAFSNWLVASADVDIQRTWRPEGLAVS